MGIAVDTGVELFQTSASIQKKKSQKKQKNKK